MTNFKLSTLVLSFVLVNIIAVNALVRDARPKGYSYDEPKTSFLVPPPEPKCHCVCETPPPTTTTPRPTTTTTTTRRTTTTTTRPPNTYLPAIPIVKKDEVVTPKPTTKVPFRGPTYLPPTKLPVQRTTTTYRVPQRTYTYGTYSVPKYTFRYTYPTYVPTRTPSRSRPDYSYTTTEGYEYRAEDFRVRNALQSG